MNILFKTLYIENFMSFHEAIVELDNNGYVLVSGVNNNSSDNALSNGSGKSSLWEAISWALTGSTIRGAKDIVNHQYIEDGSVVTLTFSVNNDDYFVLRAKDHKEYKTTLRVSINGIEKSGKGIRDTEKLLQQYLPDINSSLLGAVIILGQGLPQRFTNNTPSGRKEILEKLSKSDFMIEDLKVRINKRKSTLQSEIRTLEDLLLSGNASVKVINNEIQIRQEQLSSLQQQDTSQLEAELRVLEKYILKANTERVELEQHQCLLNNELEVNKSKQLSIFTQLNEEKDAARKRVEVSLKDSNEQLSLMSQELFSLKQRITEADKIQDVCPTCKQKIPDVHKIDTTDLKNKYDTLQRRRSELDNSIQDKTNIFNKHIADLSSNADNELVVLNKEEQEIKNSIRETASTIEGLRAEIRTAEINTADIKNKLLNQETQKQQLSASIKAHKDDVQKIVTELLYKNSEKENKEQHLQVINKFNTYITRDFRGVLLSSVIEFTNERAREYCKFIFGTENIDFKLDGNSISISYNSKEYESLSGGEKQKIDIIVQLSIRDMLCKFLDFSCNILVLDEIFDNLDSIGCEKVVDIISNKLPDISTVYIITHHSDISIPYDSEILVIKGEDGISFIK